MEWLLGVLGGIASLFFLLFNRERSLRIEAESSANTEGARKEDAVIKDRESQLVTSNQSLQAELDELEKKLRRGEELSPEEIERYWNEKH